jgi:sulfide:quinone oxidoreductase
MQPGYTWAGARKFRVPNQYLSPMAVGGGAATLAWTMNAKPVHLEIAGAGVAALEATLALQALGEGRVSVELLAPETEFTYRPLAVAEPFAVAEVKRFPLAQLVKAAGASLREGSVVAVDADRKILSLADRQEVGYDVLLLALGARPCEAVGGALTFRGPQDSRALAALLERIAAGDVRRIAFAIPAGTSWPLPLYELAILTAEYIAAHGTRNVEITLVTPEDHPLALFGPTASEAVSELLALRDITVEKSVVPVQLENDVLRIVPDRRLAVDAVVALPRLEGPRLSGVPHNEAGFVPTDELGWVLGLTDVYAAGDLTQFPLKQGGTAAQQADAAASSIAADAGAAVTPEAFKPILRGLLLTGFLPRFLRAEATGTQSVVDTEPLWWPPAKIVGRYLSPFLADQLGLGEAVAGPLREGAVPIEVELDPKSGRPAWSRV